MKHGTEVELGGLRIEEIEMIFNLRIVPVVLASLALLLTGCPGEECEPETCSELGFECGTHDDGCEGQVTCGTCDAPPLPTCDENTAVNFDDVGVCNSGACEYVDHRQECGSDECMVIGTSAVCEPATITCDHNGFDATVQRAFADASMLTLSASTTDDPPKDVLSADWWIASGALFTGPGVYSVEAGVSYDDCLFCLVIWRMGSDGITYRMFYATEGELEVSAIGGNNEPVTAELRDAVFVEWSQEENGQSVPDGERWCIDSFSWSTTLSGELP